MFSITATGCSFFTYSSLPASSFSIFPVDLAMSDAGELYVVIVTGAVTTVG